VESGGRLPPPGPPQREEAGERTFAETWQPPSDWRAILMSVFNFFQTFGYYGFAAWVPTLLIAKGINITTSLEYSYQSELFPTRIRSRAIGFVYSWSRLSAALSGLVVAFLLNLGGVNAVFEFIAFAMAVVAATIGGFGRRTRGLALEAIAH